MTYPRESCYFYKVLHLTWISVRCFKRLPKACLYLLHAWLFCFNHQCIKIEFALVYDKSCTCSTDDTIYGQMSVRTSWLHFTERLRHYNFPSLDSRGSNLLQNNNATVHIVSSRNSQSGISEVSCTRDWISWDVMDERAEKRKLLLLHICTVCSQWRIYIFTALIFPQVVLFL